MEGGETETAVMEQGNEPRKEQVIAPLSICPLPLTEKKIVELDEYVQSLDASDQWKSCFLRPTVRLEAMRVLRK